MSWPEVIQQAKTCDIVLVPIGAIEQHGPQSPVGTDSLNAIKLAERVAERSCVVIAPPIWYGAHMYHQYGFPGTIPVRTDVVKEYVKDVIKGLVNAGFKKIIILNAHGQQWALIGALHEAALETKAFIAIVTWWEVVRDVVNKTCETPFIHADECETSVALALYEDLVDMSKASKEVMPTTVSREFFGGPAHMPSGGGIPGHNITAFYFQKDVLKTGIIGDATKASREKGERIVEAFVQWMLKFIEELRLKYPPGISPFEVRV